MTSPLCDYYTHMAQRPHILCTLFGVAVAGGTQLGFLSSYQIS